MVALEVVGQMKNPDRMLVGEYHFPISSIFLHHFLRSF